MEVHQVRTRDEYMTLVHGPVLVPRWSLERHLSERHRGVASFVVPGFCGACAGAVDFRADFEWAWTSPDGLLVPNWRDRLTCPRCSMNGRQRRMTELMAGVAAGADPARTFVVYMMEAVTPLYRWVRERFAWADVVGSEFLDPVLAGGTVRGGIRHEDAEHLSFADASIDVVLSCDVLEHVDDPARVFAEIARVLKPGGRAILTFPMDPNLEDDRRRASLEHGRIRHLLPAIYHGNPLSSEGSLVFTDFGWQVMRSMRAAGLHDPTLNLYWSYEHGYLGLQFYFLASRA